MKEMCDDRMWYLIAFDLDRPVAFCSFRFDFDFGVPVVYWYELTCLLSSLICVNNPKRFNFVG